MTDVYQDFINEVKGEDSSVQQEDTTYSNFYQTQQELQQPELISYSDPLMLKLKNQVERNPQAATLPRNYTLDDLQKNEEFNARAERFMESIEKDEDIFEYLRDTDFSLSSAIVRAGQIRGWSEQEKADYNYLRNAFDNAEIGSTKQYLQLAGDLTVDLVADPINWLSAIFFVPSAGQSAAVALAAKQAGKSTLKRLTEAATKPAIVGAIEGGVWTGAHDYFLQDADVELGLRDQIDYGQTALVSSLGVGFGGAFGGALGAFTSISPKLSKKTDEYSNENDLINQAANVNRKTEEEAAGIDKAVDELIVKPDKEKRLRKRDQLIANTFGKYTTQFIGMAQNSKTLQKLLGNFRYDWARTFTEGATKLEAESYGLALSERMHGYLFKIREALNPLNRETGLKTFFKDDELRKSQNDDLAYLLRLKKKDFDNLVNSGNINNSGYDPAVIQASIKIRETLNEIFEEGVFRGLLTRSQFIDHFFPRHFSHAKIKADKQGLIKIITKSTHSLPQNNYADDAFDVRITATGKEEEVLDPARKWVDQEVFEKDFVKEASKGRTSVYEELKASERLIARKAKATQIVNNMLEKRHTPFQFGTKDNAGGGHQFLQHRVFRDIDDNELAPYLENNVEKVLEAYVTDASRAITRTQFFGKTKAAFEKKFLIPIRNELRKENIDDDEIDETIRRLRLMHERVTGLDTDQIRVKNKYGVGALDALKLSQQMAHLPLATLSSLTEPLILLTRIDSVGGKFAASKEVGKALVKGVKKDVTKFTRFVKRVSGKDVKGFADMQDEYWYEAYKVGLAMEQAVADRIESLTGEALEGSFVKKLQNAFFKVNFLSTWTGAVQLASYTTGKRIIREHAEQLYLDAENIKKLSKSKKEYIKKQLDGLGVHERFAREWYKRSLDEDGIFDEGRSQGTASTLTKPDQNKQIAFYKNHYQKGANRFTREIILNPSTAEANRPLWFSHPAGQLLAQFAGYPTVFNNTILKRWINEGVVQNKRQTSARIAGTALAMTAIATYMNAVRSGGRSLEEEDGTIILEAVQRWGGLGPADYAYRFHQNAVTGSGQAGALLKTPTGPIVSDVFDSVLYRKGLTETLATNIPFYSALPKDIRDSMKKSGRGVDKAVWGEMFPQQGRKKKPSGRFVEATRDYNFAEGGIARFNFVVGGIARSILRDAIKEINKPTPSLKEIDKLRDRISVEAKVAYDNWFDKLSKQDKFEITNKERDAMYDVNTSAFIGDGNLGARNPAEPGYTVPMDHVTKFYKENPEIEKLDILSYELFKIEHDLLFPDEIDDNFGKQFDFAKGGIVDVPNASIEPDEKKVRGLPLTYAELGGVLAQDVEDRKGFALGGIANKLAKTTNVEKIRELSADAHKDDVIRHLTKEVRQAEPIFESNLRSPLYKKDEANFYTEAVKEDAFMYVDSDLVNELDEQLQYSPVIGNKATIRPKKSGGKKIKYQGKLSIVRPLDVGKINEDSLTGSGFSDLLLQNKELRNKIINDSYLESQYARELVTKFLEDYNDTQKLITDFSNNSTEITEPLLNIKQSTQLRNLLIDLGYDSIRMEDDYILFDNAQFKVTKKLTKKNRTI